MRAVSKDRSRCPTRPPDSVLAGPFYFPTCPVLWSVCPPGLFQGSSLESCVSQTGGTRSSFQCPTGDS